MAVDSRAFIKIQLEALSVRHFIVKYDELEKKVKLLFQNNISSMSLKHINLLYFYLAGLKVTTAYIDYGNNMLKVDSVNFFENDEFKHFTMNQIIKIQRENQILKLFDFNVSSLNRKSTEYTFTDCCIKLIDMRNKIAHELADLSFKDKEIIELLSDDYIKEKSSIWFGAIDVELMSYETKCIFSNILMLEKILTVLSEKTGGPL